MSQYNMDFQMLQRVNGVTDYILRSTRSADWQE